MSDKPDQPDRQAPDQGWHAPEQQAWRPPEQQAWRPPDQQPWTAPSAGPADQPPGPAQPQQPWQANQGQGPWQPAQQPWQAHQPWVEPPRRRNTALIVVLVVGVVGLLFIGLVIAAAMIAGGMGTLTQRTPVDQVTVGSCIDGIRSGIAGEEDPDLQLALLFGVTVVDCSELHDGELIGRFDWPDAPTEYPGTEQVEVRALQGCREQFAHYVGIAFDSSTLEMTYTYPPAQQWRRGGRSFECIVHEPVGAERLTGSVRNSRR